MKKITILLIFLASSFISNAQTDKSVVEIDKMVTKIKNELKSYEKVEKVSSDEGTRFIYKKAKELRMIEVKAIENNLEKNVEWFYEDGMLSYCETNWLDTKSNKVVKIEKQYFSKGHLIAWINPKNRPVDKASIDFRMLDNDLVAYGIKIREEAMKYCSLKF